MEEVNFLLLLLLLLLLFLSKSSISNKCFSLTLTIIINVTWAANQHIRMISEDDTEDWSNDAENSALHQKNTLHFEVY